MTITSQNVCLYYNKKPALFNSFKSGVSQKRNATTLLPYYLLPAKKSTPGL